MKRDNSLMKFTTFVLLITIVAIALVSGTYAKYTSSATGTDTATVAKWSIKVGDKDIATVDTVTFDLFNTVMDTNQTATEEDIATVQGQTLIAPGTEGKFDLVIKNESQVAAQYSIAFDLTKLNGVPLEFKVGEGTWTKTPELVASNDTILAAGAEATTVTVQWRWAFEGNDGDTALGITPVTAEVSATITATQVD